MGIFFGRETSTAESLAHANKRQNRVAWYSEAIARLHRRGIAVMAGFIAGFDGDTPETVERMADNLYAIGVDVRRNTATSRSRGTVRRCRSAAEWIPTN